MGAHVTRLRWRLERICRNSSKRWAAQARPTGGAGLDPEAIQAIPRNDIKGDAGLCECLSCSFTPTGYDLDVYHRSGDSL